IGGGFSGFKGIRHSQSDILAVVADNVIFEGRASLVADAFESLALNRPEDLSDVLPMKDCSYARHFPGRSRVESGYFAFGDRCFDRHGVEQARKVEVRSVLRFTGYLERTIHARRVPTDG